MIRFRMGLACASVAGLLISTASTIALGQGSDFYFDANGKIRLDTAVKTNSRENIKNQRGNPFNQVPIVRTPPEGSGLEPDVATRNGHPASNNFNMQQVRSEFDFVLTFSPQWRAIAKVRGIYELGNFDSFGRDSVGSQASGSLHGRPDYFQNDRFGEADGSSKNPLEISGRRHMIDLPALYVDYQSGPLNLLVGNQQIAWGQALFFRILDTPNALDLRRHSLLDYAPEEFSDKRVPALGVRAMYQMTPIWLVDVFAQKFQATMLPNPNTPYNAIAAQFRVRDNYDDVKNKINYGARLRGSIGDIGLQFIATTRYNPDGVYRWTESGVDRDIPGLDGSGALMAQTPLEVDITGVWSAEEWFAYGGDARLDALEGLNALIREFPAAQDLGGYIVDNVEDAKEQLDLFYQLAGGAAAGAEPSGGLRAHIARDYYRETILGGGFSYVFQGKPGSITDQLILNVEATYTPKRRFTSISLAQRPIEDNEWIAGFVLEKYQRFFDTFPATYLVFQGMHRTESDIFGRHLSGNNGTAAFESQGGSSSFNALVFAAQQPFPNLIWRGDLSILYDIDGGVLVQPAVRWQPRGAYQVELFYNYINGRIGNKRNNNIFQGLEYANEVTLRLGYQF